MTFEGSKKSQKIVGIFGTDPVRREGATHEFDDHAFQRDDFVDRFGPWDACRRLPLSALATGEIRRDTVSMSV
jgi:hypothetical protein